MCQCMKRARFYRGTKFGYARGVLSVSTSGRAFMTAKCEQQQNQLALCSNLAARESCWGVAFPKPCTSSQAPYRSFPPNGENSLTPLLLLSPPQSLTTLWEPLTKMPMYQIWYIGIFIFKFFSPPLLFLKFKCY